ncbi:MAG: hypothetical protein CHACPFDD_00322 [Phycisphaerae bacterium]|nr:hypothetical protein [Phycisphaerae bacterium]
MAGPKRCPRCEASNVPAARFCARCGMTLSADAALLKAGQVRDPTAAAAPSGYRAVGDAANLSYRLESAWGGQRVLGTENLGLVLRNDGYALCDVVLRLRLLDSRGAEMARLEHTVRELGRGVEVREEIPSYDLPDAVHEVELDLISAEFVKP